MNLSDSPVHSAHRHNILREALGRENLAGNLKLRKESEVSQVKAGTQWPKVSGAPCGGEPRPAIEISWDKSGGENRQSLGVGRLTL